MSKLKGAQNVDGLSTKTVTWAENSLLESSEASEDLPPRTSLSSTVANPVSKTFALVKSVPLVGRIASSWWSGSSNPSIQNTALRSQILPGSKELLTVDKLEALTVSELIDNLDCRNKPRPNPRHPAQKEKGSDIVGHNYKTSTYASASSSEKAGDFIRLDTKGQAQELRIELELARAKNCWLNRDYKTMVNCAMKALELSEEFGFIEYSGKVCFYVAIAYFGTNDFAQGYQFLKHAEKCKGIFREGNLINWAEKEAALYEKRVGKKRALPSRQRTGTIRNSSAKDGSEVSSPIVADIPGRGWQFVRRPTSMSPSPVRNAQPQSDVDKGPRNSKSRATASPSPNLDSLDDELGVSNEQGEEVVDDQVE